MPAWKTALCLMVVLACAIERAPVSAYSPISGEHHEIHRVRRSAASSDGIKPKKGVPTLLNRTRCEPEANWPATRVNTTQRLFDLRQELRALNLDAFVVLSEDAHGSEYPANRDERRGWISGFTGSAGYAAVTLTTAALWTDGRYFLEAEDALDCNWIFMRQGEEGVPTMTAWLSSELTSGQTVGADPFLVSNSLWVSMEKALADGGVHMNQTMENPVDTVWDDQPPPPVTDINVLEHKYAGKTWQEKVDDVTKAMDDNNIKGAYVVTSLDEIAWLFNLRASDIDYNPFFISYAVIEHTGQASDSINLYIYDKNHRLTMNPTDPESKLKLMDHLNTSTDGTCDAGGGKCVQVKDYSVEGQEAPVLTDIRNIINANINHTVWVTYVCNYAIFSSIPENQRHQARSVIALAKSQKNPTEVAGMQRGYNRDSATLVEFLAKMDKEVKEGKRWTEVSAAAELKRMRNATELNRGLSFNSISGSGPNGAVIHYSPSATTDRNITTSEMYLLDSGGQYLDATTDVTRTMHYGKPSAYEIECYTRVLMGAIDLALVVWPEGLYGRQIDMAARAPLWSVGLDYKHGTGHGIGAYLSVHEGPGRISLHHEPTINDETLHAFMFFSDEPGYYEDGKFGIRLETIVMVEPRETKYQFGGRQHLGFKPITFVPFEPNLIDFSLLSERQMKWLNDYNQKTQETIEPLLTTDLAKAWLRERTRSVPEVSSQGHRPSFTLAALLVTSMLACSIF